MGVVVADFDIAKMIGAAPQTQVTQTNAFVGTMAYAAPEMLTAGAPVDHRADLYAGGAMFYQMLTGLIPHTMFKLPSRLRPELGTRFDALVCKALEYDPGNRFQRVSGKSECKSPLERFCKDDMKEF